ncbi:hypothetical protein SS50377_20242 [Spironucleus salmonicida]|uniref:Uncharacterized protein n=1 Tax=Spironucleus salmonicida TaxID=348837 RepID=V6LNJ7_9EUKA|nr:hypothetical protein SS50377_20242 [Spironucleus salmonicida]|eukprot:EST45296.1 Hypothetical protein SS50377_14873 [Spironucleus salmonicida]
MHLQRHHKTIDLESQLALQNIVIKQLRLQYNRQKEQFVQQLTVFRDSSEQRLHNLQIFYIEELMRVFDFSEIDEVKQHIIQLIKRSQFSAERIKDLRQVHESNMKLCQQTQNEVLDLKRQIEQLNQTIESKQMVIDELTIVNEKNTIFSDDDGANNFSITGSTQEISRMTSYTSLEECSYGKMIQKVKNQRSKQPQNFRKYKQVSEQSQIFSSYQTNVNKLGNKSLFVQNLTTTMVGDELDFRQIKLTVSEDLNQYKMTRNPINKEGYLTQLVPHSQPPIQTQENSIQMSLLKDASFQAIQLLKTNIAGQQNQSTYNEQQYISIVMPWIIDVESSKQIIMKKHAEMLEKYNETITQLNRASSQNYQYREQIFMLKNSLNQSAYIFQQKLDEHDIDIKQISEVLKKANQLKQEAESKLSLELDTQQRLNHELYNQELKIENQQQQINQFKDKILEIQKSSIQNIKEKEINKLQLKIDHQMEVIQILENQLKSVGCRMKDLEYQNQDLISETKKLQVQQENSLNNSNSIDCAMSSSKVTFLENQLSQLNSKVNEQVDYLVQRNEYCNIIQKQNDQYNQKLNQFKADNSYLKRKIIDLTSQIKGLMEEKQDQTTTLQQLVLKLKNKKIENQKESSDQKQNLIKSNMHQTSQNNNILLKSSTTKIPKGQFNGQDIIKDSLNRVLSVKRFSEENFAESFSIPNSQNNTLEFESSNQSTIDFIQNKFCLDDQNQNTAENLLNFAKTVYTQDVLDISIQNQYVQTDIVTEQLTFQNCFTQVDNENINKQVQTMMFINYDDPQILQLSKEVEYLYQQIQIYEQANIMQETKNQMISQSYSDFEQQLRNAQFMIQQQVEDIYSQKYRYYNLLRTSQSHQCPTKIDFQEEFFAGFQLQKDSYQCQIKKLENSFFDELSLNQQQRKQIDRNNLEFNLIKVDLSATLQQISIFQSQIFTNFQNLKVKFNSFNNKLEVLTCKVADQKQIQQYYQNLLRNIGNKGELLTLLNDVIYLNITHNHKLWIETVILSLNQNEQIVLSNIRGNLLQIDENKQSNIQNYGHSNKYCQNESIEQSDQESQVSLDINELITHSEQYTKLQIIIQEYQETDQFQNTQIEFLRDEVKEIKNDYDIQIKQIRLVHAGRPPRDEDIAIIHQQKLLLEKQKQQILDLSLRYKALTREFQISDGLIEMMVGGRSNSTSQVRQNKWNLNAPTLKRFL